MRNHSENSTNNTHPEKSNQLPPRGSKTPSGEDSLSGSTLYDVERVRNAPRLDGKRPVEVSTSTFLFTAMIGVPVWLAFVLPVTVLYQSGKALSLLGKSTAGRDDDEIGRPEGESGKMNESMLDRIEILPIQDRRYDVVLLGATGFTGSLAAKYLYQNYHGRGNFRWAMAGRSKEKLDKVLKDCRDNSHIMQSNQETNEMDVDLLIVDALKPETIPTLVKDAKCVISTAGPFCKYGSNVVEYCARYGTNYVDITGEVGWNKEMIMKWDAVAQHTGAKIVSLCGCDSIPWDLTYFKLAQMLREDCQDSISKMTCYDEVKGGVSGGTVDTMLTFLEGKYKTARFPFDPYYRKRDGSKSQNKSKDMSSQLIGRKVELDGKRSQWTNPFIMSSVNSEVVKRSHALNEDNVHHGQTLIYQESNVQKSFKEAFVTWFGTVFGATALLNPLTGTPIQKYIIPKPGEGPTERDMSRGYLLVSGVGEGIKGSIVESALYFPVDAGYKDTARMVSEAGLCLALDSDKLPVQGGGFYSPSAAMGDVLLDRLCKTGCKFASRVVQMQGGALKSKL